MTLIRTNAKHIPIFCNLLILTYLQVLKFNKNDVILHIIKHKHLTLFFNMIDIKNNLIFNFTNLSVLIKLTIQIKRPYEFIRRAIFVFLVTKNYIYLTKSILFTLL